MTENMANTGLAAALQGPFTEPVAPMATGLKAADQRLEKGARSEGPRV
jgi:hypothetical protein